ncbi:nitrogen fixation protein NifH [Dehalogenimonas etheniformans]|uniref:Nitrogen fixation protein NifH n=1 Tax=Dehalogenimonas etheniformans TaxID=1536648 RepID=A0A2P5P958_9CHLR|nr:nitrogen fixation protein NifH [Dehalogenimonas etheniformans]PPD58815.1 nitrogen fixation protein NifH [Dehalogenimonas etheniformans]QNT76416.1 nitrogen fixation protein NifH [Dehalogenimonas etheniformans]
MPTWRELIHGDPLTWLLEVDDINPAVRYLALRDIVGLPEKSPDLVDAKSEAYSIGPIPRILAAQNPKGYWVKPGGGYNPKYTGTVWSLTLLAQMGADKSEPRVKTAAEYVLKNTISPTGWFSYNGMPSGFIHCHAGYLGDAMFSLGFGDDSRVTNAVEMQARLVTGRGIAAMGSQDPLRYYHYTAGPNFICGKLPCAWGAVKALKAISSVPEPQRTQTMSSAIEKGKDLFLSTDLTKCRFTNLEKGKPSSNWFKFGFPNYYIGDLLEILEVMARLGDGRDLRLEQAWKMVLEKQDSQGRWPLEYSYNGKMWADIEIKDEPSKWVTLRALRALKAAFPG